MSSRARRSATSSTGPASAPPLFAANAPIAKTLRPVREESVDFDTTKNLFIEGDNLDALKLLQESYLGKVKLIYIDPPYNTGNDFVYDDDFAESTAEYLARSGQVDDDGRPARRQHRGERALPLRLAEHDVPAAEAGAEPARRRRRHLRLHRRRRAREPPPAARRGLRASRTSSATSSGRRQRKNDARYICRQHDYIADLSSRTRRRSISATVAGSPSPGSTKSTQSLASLAADRWRRCEGDDMLRSGVGIKADSRASRLRARTQHRRSQAAVLRQATSREPERRRDLSTTCSIRSTGEPCTMLDDGWRYSTDDDGRTIARRSRSSSALTRPRSDAEARSWTTRRSSAVSRLRRQACQRRSSFAT